jgi:hypothetical protein
MFATVKKLFEKEHRDLLDCLGWPGEFWEGVRDNTISNQKLNEMIDLCTGVGGTDWSAARAARTVLHARQTGILRNPET